MSAAAAFRDSAAQFFGWWRSELAALVPGAILAARKPKPRSDIHVSREGITIDRLAGGIGERYHESRPLEALDQEGWAEFAQVIAGTRPRLILGVPDVYVASLTLPAAARGRLKPAVSLQLSQVAPLDPSLLVWTASPGLAEGGQFPVAIAMARAERAAQLQGLFAEHGLPVPAIAAHGPNGLIELCPAGAGGEDLERRATRRAAVASALLLLSIPFTTSAGAWLLAGMAEDRAESVSKQIAPRLAAERKAERDLELRRALAVVHQHPSATATLEALALATPDTDHLLSAARAPDGTLQASADSVDPEELRAALGKAPLRPQLEPIEIVPIEGKPKRARVELRSAGL